MWELRVELKNLHQSLKVHLKQCEFLSSGIQTGSCVRFDVVRKTCEVSAWCPVETKTSPPRWVVFSGPWHLSSCPCSSYSMSSCSWCYLCSFLPCVLFLVHLVLPLLLFVILVLLVLLVHHVLLVFPVLVILVHLVLLAVLLFVLLLVHLVLLVFPALPALLVHLDSCFFVLLDFVPCCCCSGWSIFCSGCSPFSCSSSYLCSFWCSWCFLVIVICVRVPSFLLLVLSVFLVWLVFLFWSLLPFLALVLTVRCVLFAVY